MRSTKLRFALIGAFSYRLLSSVEALGTSRFSATTMYHAFPLSQLAELRERYSNVKVIHIIRHAEGTHNVNRQYKDEINIDARLTEKGIAQCQDLAAAIADSPSHHVHNAELVITSTMTRCIQTALKAFPMLVEKPEIPVLAHESLRETVNYACDRRRPISQTRQEFPRVDFSHVSVEEDEIWEYYLRRLGPPSKWDSHRESAELWKVAERGRDFWKWLASRPEQHVIICTHAAFLRCTMSWGQHGGVEFLMEQTLDDRIDPGPDLPLLSYNGDKNLESYVRKDYGNCEVRSFVVVFDSMELAN
jgi:broad specificity phosphatase PhoE